MTNTVDELLESLVAATINNEVKWSKGTEALEDVLEELFVIDADDFEILNEVTDEDADDAKLFPALMEAIEEVK